MLHWDRPFVTVRSGNFETGDIVWFPEGGLNASYNCVDRWAYKHPEKVRCSENLPSAISTNSEFPILSLSFISTNPARFTPITHIDRDHLRGRRAWRRLQRLLWRALPRGLPRRERAQVIWRQEGR